MAYPLSKENLDIDMDIDYPSLYHSYAYNPLVNNSRKMSYMKRDDRLIFLLSVAHQAVRNYVNKALAAEGVRLTLAQSGVLFLLKQQDRRKMSTIGKILGIENSAMTGLIDRLEKSGFVNRQSDPDDRRALLINATPAGLEEACKAIPVIREVNEAIKSACHEHELEGFKRVLDELLKQFKGT